jgi:hypothetical protein
MAAADCHLTLRASTGVARPLIPRITIAGAFPALNGVLAQVWCTLRRVSVIKIEWLRSCRTRSCFRI